MIFKYKHVQIIYLAAPLVLSAQTPMSLLDVPEASYVFLSTNKLCISFNLWVASKHHAANYPNIILAYY